MVHFSITHISLISPFFSSWYILLSDCLKSKIEGFS
nr:MAG TPA: hypothetical protein [Caudoviricetes sp.]